MVRKHTNDGALLALRREAARSKQVSRFGAFLRAGRPNLTLLPLSRLAQRAASKCAAALAQRRARRLAQQTTVEQEDVIFATCLVAGMLFLMAALMLSLTGCGLLPPKRHAQPWSNTLS